MRREKYGAQEILEEIMDEQFLKLMKTLSHRSTKLVEPQAG